MSETFNEASNDRIALSVQKTEKRDENTINQGGPDNPPYFAKITALAKDEGDEDIPKRAKGIQYYYDSDALDKQEAVDAWIFDDDSEELLRTGDIYSDTAMKVDDIVEVVRYNDRTSGGNQMQWLVRTGGAAVAGSLWARVEQTYPATGGVLIFSLFSAPSITAPSVDAEGETPELILEGFVNTSASLTSRSYFNGKMFPCSLNSTDGKYYFYHPIF